MRRNLSTLWSAGTLGALILIVAPLAMLGCDSDEDRRTGVVRKPGGSTGASTQRVGSTPSTPTAPVAIDESIPEGRAQLEPVTVEPPQVSFEEAEAAFLEKRYGEAVDLFAIYTDRVADNPWGHYMLGLSAWKAGDLVRAEDAFGRALELDPHHQKSIVNLTRVMLEQGRTDEALGRIELVLELNPESNSGHRVMGRVRHELGDLDEAITSYQEAITIDDEDAWSMNNLGFIYIQQERFEDALLPLARATELEDGVAIFLNNLGVALERTGHFVESAEAYKAALAVNEYYDKAAVNLARVDGLGEKTEAEPVDLTALSRSFQDEIQRWRGAEVAGTAPVESDSSVVGIADIGKGQGEEPIPDESSQPESDGESDENDS